MVIITNDGLNLPLFPVVGDLQKLSESEARGKVRFHGHLDLIISKDHDLKLLYGRMAPRESMTHYFERYKQFEPVDPDKPDGNHRLQVTIEYYEL
jgi:hypothetical protein